jgi:hypothetical protein
VPVFVAKLIVCADTIDVARENGVVEEALGDRLVGAGIDLAFEDIDVRLERGALGMLLGIGRNGHVEIAEQFDAGDQFRRAAIALRMRLVARSGASGRIAPQRHDAADAHVPIGGDHLVHFGARGANAGEMRRRGEHRLVEDALDGVVRPLPRRPSRTIGHRDEVGRERRHALDRTPQGLLHRLAFRREELEGEADLPEVAQDTRHDPLRLPIFVGKLAIN